ncbi:MAG: hypothetical protein KC503_41655 [Myxococcales bacterium]|nr:hypothetical protein [Myxococcales bacterium]
MVSPRRTPDDAVVDPGEQLLRIIGGKWLAAAVSAAAELRLAEALSDGPRAVDALAGELACDADALSRLVRVLCGVGVLAAQPDHTVSLTPLGEKLRRDELGDLAVYTGAPFSWNPWSQLASAIRSGRSPFALEHDIELFDYLDRESEHGRVYQHAIDAFTRREARALAEAFDFSRVERVVDVGGGVGTALVALLEAYPELRATLLERPAVEREARAVLDAAGVGDRCDFVGGDFFASLPRGADAYIVMHIVHNWDDPRAAKVLENCVEAMNDDGRVLVIEGTLLPGNRPDAIRLLDLEMLVLGGGGRERSKPELRRLFNGAGLTIESSSDLAGTTRLFVLRKR